MTKVLQKQLTPTLPDQSTYALKIAKLVSQTIDQSHALAKGLHPIDLDADSLTSALQELAAYTEHLFGIRCNFESSETISSIADTATAVHLYRITQESITNAIQHGKAKNIHIELFSGKKKSVLTIKSDGLDFPGKKPRNKGMGLRIIDYRAEMINGTFDIRRAEEGGSIATCVFPHKKIDNTKKHGSKKRRN
jgi:signal transduction histidine kinase